MSAAHIHLALTHIPVLFLPLGTLILTWGIYQRQAIVRRVAFAVLALGTVVAIPVYLTGEPAEEIVEDSPQVAESIIEEHEEAAELALVLSLITGALALLALWAQSQSRWEGQTALVVLAAGLISSGLLLRTANLGGQIRHAEIRTVASGGPSETGKEAGGEKDDDDDD